MCAKIEIFSKYIMRKMQSKGQSVDSVQFCKNNSKDGTCICCICTHCFLEVHVELSSLRFESGETGNKL